MVIKTNTKYCEIPQEIYQDPNFLGYIIDHMIQELGQQQEINNIICHQTFFSVFIDNFQKFEQICLYTSHDTDSLVTKISINNISVSFIESIYNNTYLFVTENEVFEYIFSIENSQIPF